MEAIAHTAGVGKDTVYRRWSSKEELVGRLLTVLADEGVRPGALDDDPRFALFLFLQAVMRLNTESDFGAIVAGVVGESARNAELATKSREFWAARRQIARDLVRDTVGPTSQSEAERIVDHLVGPVYYRLLLSGDPVTDEYLWDLVMTIPWPADDPS